MYIYICVCVFVYAYTLCIYMLAFVVSIFVGLYKYCSL